MGTEADAVQHGGSHYKGVPEHLQHWNVVAAMGWDYFVGTATKYLWRLGKKDDPVLELEKAIHYLQKKRELLLEERGVLVNKPVEGPYILKHGDAIRITGAGTLDGEYVVAVKTKPRTRRTR